MFNAANFNKMCNITYLKQSLLSGFKFSWAKWLTLKPDVRPIDTQ